MGMATIVLFFVYTWGLGFTVTSFIKNSENFLERNLMRIGIGAGVFIILGVLLNLFRIPLDWKVFFVLSLAYPIYSFLKKRKSEEPNQKSRFRLTKSNIGILIVLFIFLISLYMYAGGAFKYPYLEDDDPWAYAISTKYVAIEKTLNEPANFHFKFIDPYPPSYSLIMGVLHQTTSSLMWTLKFFNALIISLGIIFFYFFAKEFTKSRNKALFSTFVLAIIPCFFTHFIWALSLSVPLFFVSMYYLERIRYDKKSMYVAGLAIAGVFLTQPSMALKIALLFGVYFVIKGLIYRQFLKQIFYSYVFGSLISLLWWFSNGLDMVLRGARAGGGKNTLVAGESLSIINYIQRAFPPSSGTATKAYSFSDFFVAKPYGGINVHVGFGIFISLLLILALVYIIVKYKQAFQKKKVWIPIALAWFILMFLNINSLTFNLPVGFFSFRSWLLLAIPAALFSSLGFWFLLGIGKKCKISGLMILIIVVVGLIATAGYQKYKHNTLPTWPPGVSWTSAEELQGYLWLKTLPPDTNVFVYSTIDQFAVGMDKYSCAWCDNVIEFRKTILDKDLDQLHSFLKSNNYKYVVFSGMGYMHLGEEFGENKTKESIDALLSDISNSTDFRLAHQTQGAAIFEVL